MKVVLLFLSALLLTGADLATVRQKYVSAANVPADAEALYKMLENVPDDSADNTMVAYKAGALTLRAKHEKGLLNKKKLFTQGAKLLEAVIKRDADNYEVRVIRLTIQENAPKITGYHKQIDEDKKFLIKNFSAQKADLKEFTKGFVKASPSFTKEEKAAF
ncbi:hypothetical protein [Flavobacterium subsaxonicum]|uniref:DUF4252 domain-containing protein n=1 Tax=Flavobacterium subsaxonicum WB 4.1-42 = DSM 21790 TaxID=1121898 RepID=A0A0A2MF39_9FLAO|nr:hypothetical protein [Flavobacterium subsaxonicum]KGO91297.1 hypothetical protein Q766_18645 [Flavobacterium subsaxonicum WB 4.1-42 = DSM 21790]